MAVLAEGCSVIIKRQSIFKHFSGGWDAFVDFVPNSTLCFDDDIARVGFMSASDADAFVKALSLEGLASIVNGSAVDVAQVDQIEGVITPCDWLGFVRMENREHAGTIPVCWFDDMSPLPTNLKPIVLREGSMGIVMPHDWKFEGSLSQTNNAYSSKEFYNRFKFLRIEDKVEVYLDTETDKEVVKGSNHTG